VISSGVIIGKRSAAGGIGRMSGQNVLMLSS
jgi:hypothetical protein